MNTFSTDMEKVRIQKLLIANRGEIAVRIVRTCRELGIKTVAVYSEVDRTAAHVRLADEAQPIGGAAAEASYLAIGSILSAAERSGADAVHPGYGFLSENADFAQACVDAGLIFVGPSPEAIRLMGDKSAARKRVASAGIPIVPGTRNPVESEEEALQIGEEIGYPLLIKAAAGGGGKGMRVVENAREFSRAMAMARSEAKSAFGDGRVFIEKYLSRPRHIEFQILADRYGQTVHLFERECSIQRRHQKIIEEAPSAILTPEQRAEMGAAAVRSAQSCGYTNAGTVEFLLDEGNFYFIEVNARLQVEHPVTEWITGMDLVAEQIRIAQGDPLGYDQSDLTFGGHAIECRIYAEDPRNQFLPDPGTLLRHHPPAGFGVRVDSGIEAGEEIQIYYDPMIAKISTWGRTRPEALQRMSRALGEYEIAGVETTIPFCRFVMEHDAFQSGSFSTHFVADHFDPRVLESGEPEEDLIAALAAVVLRQRQNQTDQKVGNSKGEHTRPAPGNWVRNRRRW